LFRCLLLLLALAGCAPPAPRPVTPTAFGGGVGYSQDNLIWVTQWELNRLLFYKGKLDGVLGPDTVGAIKQFEIANDMPVDGQPSGFLLDRLRQTPSGK